MGYDVIIIGAGASGLFCASQFSKNTKCLVLEHTNEIGKKLLMSGQGQCNFTNGIEIKEFVNHYGKQGKKIRSILYKYNNIKMMEYIKEKGLDVVVREDAKVFPSTLKSQDVLDCILSACKQKQVEIKKNVEIIKIEKSNQCYQVTTNQQTLLTKYLIIATGGCSYPLTGSDDSILPILKDLKIDWKQRKQALVPIYIKEHSYRELSGISLKEVSLSINGKRKHSMDDLLITHFGFSGPLILNHSRDIDRGDLISFNYFPTIPKEELIRELRQEIHKSKKTTLLFLQQYFNNLPKRLIELMLLQLDIDATKKASNLSNKELEQLLNRITNDCFKVDKLGSYQMAMVSKGGVSLDGINLKNLESKKHPNLYFVGEILDVDGDTGGFNLQFAFSSASLVSNDIETKQSTNTR